jgi:hypothetical protein
MFGDCTQHGTTTLDAHVAAGTPLDMENYFSRLALDIIGKAVFNYDFDSLTHDDPVIQVRSAAGGRRALAQDPSTRGARPPRGGLSAQRAPSRPFPPPPPPWLTYLSCCMRCMRDDRSTGLRFLISSWRAQPFPPPHQAVYTVLREAQHRSTAPNPDWDLPGAAALVPRQRRCREALATVNATLDGLIAKCKALVDEEGLEFGEEFLSDRDPSILHFLLASGDEISSKQVRGGRRVMGCGKV